MEIFDLHCDFLCQTQMHRRNTMFSFERMVAGGVRVQVLAIFVSRDFKGDRWKAMHEQATMFAEWCKHNKVEPLLSKLQLQNHQSKRSAMLTVEGLDDVPADEEALALLHTLGMRSLSLTWNGANAAADGALATVHGGITEWGKRVVRWCNRNRVAIDVSHLSEQAFWDVLQESRAPIYCSHSNAKSVYWHPRNLSDEQLVAIIKNNGTIGITFVPAFLNRANVSDIADVIKNVYRVCELGGSNHLSFGSDFDGVEVPVNGIEHTGKWPDLVQAFIPHFSYTDIEKFTFRNASRYFLSTL